MTPLNGSQTRSDAENVLVPLAVGQGVPTPETQQAASAQTTLDDEVKQEREPSIFQRWMFLKHNRFTIIKQSHIKTLKRGKLGLATAVNTFERDLA